MMEHLRKIQWWEWLWCAAAFAFSLYLAFSHWDRTINQWAMDTLTGDWQVVMSYLSRAGQGGIQTCFAIAVAVFYYWRGDFAASRVWFCSFPIYLSAGLFTYVLKVIFGRARPKLWHGEGFYGFEPFDFAARMHAYPSGHTVTTFALLAVVMNLYKPKWWPLFFMLAFIVASGRIGIGAHWPADVIAGAAIGYLCGRWARFKFSLDRSTYTA